MFKTFIFYFYFSTKEIKLKSDNVYKSEKYRSCDFYDTVRIFFNSCATA